MGNSHITIERSIEINKPDFIFVCTKCRIPKLNCEYAEYKAKGGK